VVLRLLSSKLTRWLVGLVILVVSAYLWTTLTYNRGYNAAEADFQKALQEAETQTLERINNTQAPRNLGDARRLLCDSLAGSPLLGDTDCP